MRAVTMQENITESTIQQLILAAINGMRNAVTPMNDPNDNRFGAAVLTESSNIYSAGQYFSDTYSLTLHAEQCALVHAAAHGEYKITAIAIISNKSGKEKTNPCHMCKQILYENYLRFQYNYAIYLLNSYGDIIETTTISDMIQYPWPKNK